MAFRCMVVYRKDVDMTVRLRVWAPRDLGFVRAVGELVKDTEKKWRKQRKQEVVVAAVGVEGQYQREIHLWILVVKNL